MKKWISILVIAMIVIGLSTGGVLAVREFYFKEEPDEKVRAEEGDNVEIHYVGRLKDDRIYDSQRIFDTSYADIPGIKSPAYTLTYQERERGEPFNFTLGEGVIEGWNENVRGMREGESKRFSVPPEKGYGKASEKLRYQIQKTESVPVYEKMDVEKFQEKYGEPRKNMLVEDDFWGWDKVITSRGKNWVLLRNEPEAGETYRPTGGWKVKVESIDSTAADGYGEINLKHIIREPIAIDSELLSVYDKKFANIPQLKRGMGQSQDGQGIIIPNEDHITVDFNDEVKGKTLYFEVEVLNIKK
ncbi:MAG: FKBP-type peptidyl-prolyl cis-trans isomerase [Candidatus Thermoplasmatota archaeon]|nr:FKBP-type peptidyl-prolyl cis-trans isomerase [Candidatus Thermoplasmatota archaeon]